jgi:hypothetical protein
MTSGLSQFGCHFFRCRLFGPLLVSVQSGGASSQCLAGSCTFGCQDADSLTSVSLLSQMTIAMTE